MAGRSDPLVNLRSRGSPRPARARAPP